MQFYHDTFYNSHTLSKKKIEVLGIAFKYLTSKFSVYFYLYGSHYLIQGLKSQSLGGRNNCLTNIHYALHPKGHHCFQIVLNKMLMVLKFGHHDRFVFL